MEFTGKGGIGGYGERQPNVKKGRWKVFGIWVAWVENDCEVRVNGITEGVQPISGELRCVQVMA